MIDFDFGVRFDTISEKDIETLRLYRNKREVNKWCRQTGLISELDQKEWFKRQNDDKTCHFFAVKGLTDPSLVLGVAGLTSIDYHAARAEFSLYIDSAQHCRGYGKKALKTLLTYGFVDLGLNCIWGETFDENPALQLFLSLGMKLEGTRRQFYFKEGRFVDAHLVSMLQLEYLEQTWHS